jgi:hypothetical protein
LIQLAALTDFRRPHIGVGLKMSALEPLPLHSSGPRGGERGRGGEKSRVGRGKAGRRQSRCG